MTEDKPSTRNEFEQAAADERGPSLIREFWQFLHENKKWWLLPMIVVVLLMGALMMLSNTAAAPFIYTLF